MRVYLDSGPIIDYLRFRTPLVDSLRQNKRGKRTPSQISADLEKCFTGLKRPGHSALTSTLTFVELENALYAEMKKKATSIKSNKASFLLLTSHALVDATLAICNLESVQVVNLEPAHVQMTMNDSAMKSRGLSFRDSLHLSTAILADADALLTGDGGLKKLDSMFRNMNGTAIRCLDSDMLHPLL